MFSFQINRTIDINTTPETAWQELTNFADYNNWNPMLQNVQTELQLKAPVDFEVLVGKTKRLKLKAKMTRIDNASELRWAGGNALTVKGEHYFRIEKLSDNQIRLHHGEFFKGLLLVLMKKSLQRSAPLYSAMNESLKARLEN